MHTHVSDYLPMGATGAADRWSKGAAWIAVGVTLLGGLVLLGWALGVPLLQGALPGPVPVRPNAAVGFLLSGLALGLLRDPQSEHRVLAGLCAVLALSIGLATVAQYVFHFEMGIDQWLFREASGAHGTTPPGRMAPSSAVNFVLLGLALLTLDVETRGGSRPAQWLALGVLTSTAITAEGYLLGFVGLNLPDAPFAMAFPSAAAFAALGLGIFWIRPAAGWMALLTESSEDFRLLRWMLPAMVVIPVLTGWFHVITERRGLLSREAGEEVQSLANVFFLSLIFSWAGQRVLRLQANRRRLENDRRRLSELYATLSQVRQAIVRVDPEQGFLLDTVQVCARTGHFDLASIVGRGERDLQVLASEGSNGQLLEGRSVTLEGCPAAIALREGHSAIVQDWEEEPPSPVRERIRAAGFRSSAAFPILEGSGSATALELHSRQRSFFSPERVELLAGLAEDLGHAGAKLVSEARYRNLFEQAAVGVVETDRETGRFLATNRTFQELVGYTAEELAGMDFLALTHPADRGKAKSHFVDIRAGRMRENRIEKRYLRRNGEAVWVQVTVSAVELGDGTVRSFMGVIEDISERKRLQDELSRANLELERRVEERTAQLQFKKEELEAFAYNVSHDLRAPLRAVSGFAEILERQDCERLSEEGRESLARIRSGAVRMAQIIEDLLRLSQVGRGDLVRVPLDLCAMAEKILGELAQRAPERRIRFSCAKSLPVQGDPRLMRLLLENLLGNAVKFTATREEAILELGVGPASGPWVEVFVRDNGVGFPAGQGHRLFTPFQRLHGEEFQGTGIGLALVKRIVAAHGGQVRAQSEEGKGACITFTLPTDGEAGDGTTHPPA